MYLWMNGFGEGDGAHKALPSGSGTLMNREKSIMWIKQKILIQNVIKCDNRFRYCE